KEGNGASLCQQQIKVNCQFFFTIHFMLALAQVHFALQLDNLANTNMNIGESMDAEIDSELEVRGGVGATAWSGRCFA
ncbi:hypothetical protein ACJX0J_024257, partial [Zea mays]